MKVLHIELGRHLYGGARQVVYLLDGLAAYPGEHVLVTCPGADIASAIQNPAVRVRELAFRGDHDLGFIGRLRRLLREERPDLIHLHSRRGDFGVTLAGKLERIPMIHSRRVDNPPRWLDIRLKFPCFAKIVTISEGIRRVLLASGVPAEQVVCVPSAVDTERFQPSDDSGDLRRELGLSAGPLVGVIAQLIARKGHAVLFDALPEVLARHPEVQALLFGQGPLEAELRQQVQTRGLAAQVRFVGYRNDMPRVIPGLDIVVHPAWMEGLGVSLLETAACGVPIIAARAGGIPEIVHPGLNGYLIEPGDARALAHYLNELLDQPERRQAFGAAGRQLVLERFSIARMVAGNHAVYRSL